MSVVKPHKQRTDSKLTVSHLGPIEVLYTYLIANVVKIVACDVAVADNGDGLLGHDERSKS